MLKDWQRDNGLVADGIFGKTTAKKIADKYKIKNPAEFFGQICHESLDLTLYIENLNYSMNGLLKTFPKYFNSSTALVNANKPQSIANIVYANRMGNTLPNDGWYFRGRGAIQLTGRANYKAFEKWLGLKNSEIMLNPDLVYEKFYIESAIFFFDVNKLWNITDVTALTRRVNGGTNGLQDRINRSKKYKTWF